MKLKTTQPHRIGRKINVPEDGEVQIDETGVVEVSEKAGKILLTQSTGWEAIAEASTEDEEVDAVVAYLNAIKSLKDFKQLAIDSNLPEEEYSDFKKKSEWVNYLKDKITLSEE